MKTPILLSLLSLLAHCSCTTTRIPYDAPTMGSPEREPSRSRDASELSPMKKRQSSAGANSAIALLLGGRVLDNDDWSPLDDQLAAGLEFSSIPKYFPVGIELGYLGSYQSEDASNGSLTETLHGGQHEVYLGPRFGFQDPAWSLWAGLGFSVIYNQMEGFVGGSKQKGDDTVFGGYGHVGIEYKISKSFGVGLDARGMYGQEASILGQDRKTTYLQMALLFAFHF